MRKLRRGVLVTVLLLTLASMAAAEDRIEKLAWLGGAWKIDSNGRVIEEQWTAPAGGMMIGMSRTVKNGKTVEFEYLRIQQRDDGIFYIAQPGGRPATEFKLTSASESEWIFENLQHDFPKRIRYRRNADGSLRARVEDETGKKGMDFSYARVQ